MTRSAPPQVLPSRDGVGVSCVSMPAGPWPRVADFLVARFPAIAAAEWRERMASGQVLNAQGLPLGPEAPAHGPQRIYYFRHVPGEQAVPFTEDILFHDDHLLVADKPHFMAVTPGGRHLQHTLLVRLKQRLGIDSLVPLHRIDRETAGLVLFSVNPASRGRYAALFRNHVVHKTYEAIAPLPGTLALPLQRASRIEGDADFFRQREVPGPPNATVAIALLAAGSHRALYRLEPTTGLRHQLRVQMLGLGLPMANDQFYPVPAPAGEDDFTRPLQLLARSLQFTDPVTGAHRAFASQRSLNLALLDSTGAAPALRP